MFQGIFLASLTMRKAQQKPAMVSRDLVAGLTGLWGCMSEFHECAAAHQRGNPLSRLEAALPCPRLQPVGWAGDTPSASAL